MPRRILRFMQYFDDENARLHRPVVDHVGFVDKPPLARFDPLLRSANERGFSEQSECFVHPIQVTLRRFQSEFSD